MKTVSITTFALAAMVAAATPAYADSRSMEVRYGDLDLASAEGAATLQQRLDRAVRRVCGQADVRDLKAQADVRNCRTAAKDDSARAYAMAMSRSKSGDQLASVTIGQ